MPSCCIKNCESEKENQKPPLTLHKFPVDEHMRKKWIEIIGIENINPRRKMWYVCHEHLTKRTYSRAHGGRRLCDFMTLTPEKDKANNHKDSQKIITADDAQPSTSYPQEDHSQSKTSVRNFEIDRERRLIENDWAQIQQIPGYKGPKLDSVATSVGLAAVNSYAEDTGDQEDEALQPSRETEMIEFPYSSTDSADSESDVYIYDSKTKKLKKIKQQPEPSPPDTSVTIQISEFETVRQLKLDQEIERVINNLQQEGKIQKPVDEDMLDAITGEGGIIEQHKSDAIIANVYYHLKQEYDTLKNLLNIKYDLGPLSDLINRTAMATDVAPETVITALQAHKLNMDIYFDHNYAREYSRLNAILRQALQGSTKARLGRGGKRNKRLLSKQVDDESDGASPPKRRFSDYGVSSSSEYVQMPLTGVYSGNTKSTINISQANNNNVSDNYDGTYINDGTYNNNDGIHDYCIANNNIGTSNNNNRRNHNNGSDKYDRTYNNNDGMHDYCIANNSAGTNNNNNRRRNNKGSDHHDGTYNSDGTYNNNDGIHDYCIANNSAGTNNNNNRRRNNKGSDNHDGTYNSDGTYNNNDGIYDYCIANNNSGTSNNNNRRINNNGTNCSDEEDDEITGKWLKPRKDLMPKNIAWKTPFVNQQVPSYSSSSMQFKQPGLMTTENNTELAAAYPTLEDYQLETESSATAVGEPSEPPDAAQVVRRK